MERMTRMVESVVDYKAWEKGYMPPSEHVLIDALSYRGAQVILSSSSQDSGYWLVVKGPPKFRGRRLRAMMQQIEIILAEIEDEDAAEIAKQLAVAATEEPPPHDATLQRFLEAGAGLEPAAFSL